MTSVTGFGSAVRRMFKFVQSTRAGKAVSHVFCRRDPPSFWTMSPTDATRIAYQVVLDREPDASGRATFEPLLAGELSQRQLVDSLLASPEFALRWSRQQTVWEASAGDEPTTVALEDGVALYVDPGDLLISHVIRDTGLWEPHITALVRRILTPGSLFLDVGANIGYFTMLAGKLVGPNGRVVAFEPAPRNVQLLLASVVTNGFSHVEVWPVALSDRRGIVGLRTETWNTNSTVAPMEASVVGETTLAVAVPGDHVLGSVDHDGTCIVKLDVEGHEHAVLLGLERFLDVHRPTLVLEFNPSLINATGGSADEQLAWLFEHFPHIGCVAPGGAVEPLNSPASALERWGRSAGSEDRAVPHLDLVAAHTNVGIGTPIRRS